MARSILLLLTGVFVALPASADVFKCAEKNGMDRYQNFPCAIDSLGSVPSVPLSANTTSPAGGAAHTRATAMPLAVASAGRSVNTIEPRVGMTEGEVRAIWGDPEEIVQDEPIDGRIEIWRYGGGRFVQFSNKHRALVVQR